MPHVESLDDEIFNDWWHANHAWHHGHIAEAEHIYRNLRASHGVELFYEVQLQMPVKFVHPLGTVLGRATYAPHLVVYQGVSVGSTVDNERPTFTGPCVLFPHSGVIGPVTVGKNVWITAGTIVEARPGKPWAIPDNSIVSRGVDGACNYNPTARNVVDHYFTPKRRTSDRTGAR